MVNVLFRKFVGVYIAVAERNNDQRKILYQKLGDNQFAPTRLSPAGVRCRRCFLASMLDSPGVEL